MKALVLCRIVGFQESILDAPKGVNTSMNANITRLLSSVSKFRAIAKRQFGASLNTLCEERATAIFNDLSIAMTMSLSMIEECRSQGVPISVVIGYGQFSEVMGEWWGTELLIARDLSPIVPEGQVRLTDSAKRE